MAHTVNLQQVPIDKLVPYERNAKVHGTDQIQKLKASMQEFGFVSPILIDEQNRIIAGHGRVQAARELGMTEVPAVYVEGLTETQRRAYIIADNRLTELGGWDDDLLQEELKGLSEDGFDIDLTGFELEDVMPGEVDADVLAEVNPTAALPESRIIVCSISTFGTGSEKILLIPIPQEQADAFIKRCEEMSTADIAARVLEALNAV